MIEQFENASEFLDQLRAEMPEFVVGLTVLPEADMAHTELMVRAAKDGAYVIAPIAAAFVADAAAISAYIPDLARSLRENHKRWVSEHTADQ